MNSFQEILDEHLGIARRLDMLRLQDRLARAVEVICAALAQNLPVLVCGNGGSAVDALHVAAELVGRFQRERRAFNVQCLSANTAVLTAWSNDYSFDTVFARQVEAHGAQGGVLWAFSTSGRSKNIVLAAKAARTAKMSVVALTGDGGGDLGPLSDVLLDVPSSLTPRIQGISSAVLPLSLPTHRSPAERKLAPAVILRGGVAPNNRSTRQPAAHRPLRCYPAASLRA